jgi:hypothetical protein
MDMDIALHRVYLRLVLGTVCLYRRDRAKMYRNQKVTNALSVATSGATSHSPFSPSFPTSASL